ncbi:MAG: hypothetical protein J6S72_06905 [Lachnospiraceae bacterium]|nr:hypothetical protein [Lachnospiraceae bacterium]MBP5653221.1 hypothetical protein [Lachnospiraceae bacterium]
MYELFSHEVYSYYMIYAFALPLVLGLLPGILMLSGRLRVPDRAACRVWNCGVATLTVGAVCKGVLDIYGTSNRLIYVYAAAGAALIFAGAVLCAAKRRTSQGVRDDQAIYTDK